LKILFLSHSFYPAIGGIETISDFLANTFHNAGHQLHVVTWTQEKGKKIFPFKIIRNPHIFQLLKEHSWADLIFENNPTLRLGWPALLVGRPSIITLHTWVSRINGEIGWQDKLKALWLKRAKKVLAVSDALRKESWPTATVIANPYQDNIFRIIPNIARTSDFVFLGRLVSDKGAKLAIEAFIKIVSEDKYNKSRQKLTLTIIGDGPEREGLENVVSASRLKDSVLFKGFLKGQLLAEELNKHKFLLVPSAWKEPFGIVVLEGMACGCIPIVSDSGGLYEAVGDAGVTFKTGNVDSFVTVIKQLLENPAFAQELRSRAPAHLAEHHAEVIAEKYLFAVQNTIDNIAKKKKVN
jgi:glycosyltransferase involved in cell wall biosynthesis